MVLEKSIATLYIRESFESVDYCEPQLRNFADTNGIIVKNILVCNADKAEISDIIEHIKKTGCTCLIMRGMTHLSCDPIVASEMFVSLYTQGIRLVTTKFYGIDTSRNVDKAIFNIFYHYLRSFTQPYSDYIPIPIDPEGHPKLTDR